MDVIENLRQGKYENKVKFSIETRNEYREEERRIHDRFKQDLFDEFEVTNNPKAEKCFGIAWDHGHSGGYMEVYNYFSEFVELIK